MRASAQACDAGVTATRSAYSMLQYATKSIYNTISTSRGSIYQCVFAPVTQVAQQACDGSSLGAWQRRFVKQAGNGEQSTSNAGGTESSSDETEAAGKAAADAAAAPLDAAELQALCEKAQEEAASYKDRLQRSHAEMQNLIARQSREKETLQTYAVQKFAESLLEVADNLESAARAVPREVLQEGAEVPPEMALKYLRSLLEGVQATERVLLKTMGSKGVQRIETEAGDDFDPNTMEAMSTMACSGPAAKPGSIANVWQSGYKIHDRILRAAKVIVYQE